jgi:hypothetical protein
MHHLYLNRMIVYPHNAQQNYGQIISDSANWAVEFRAADRPTVTKNVPVYHENVSC